MPIVHTIELVVTTASHAHSALAHTAPQRTCCTKDKCTIPASHLLHQHRVVPLKGDVHVHVGLHGADLVGSEEAHAAAALAALLQHLQRSRTGTSLIPALDTCLLGAA